MMTKAPTRTDIDQAHERIMAYIHRTPVMTSNSLDELAVCQLFFKCENLQKVGAFKARGAMNAVLSLSREERAHGVATHSSGNHAQALARAAKIMGIKAHIVIPSTAPPIKKLGVQGYGGIIYECEPTLAARESMLFDVVAKTGAIEIHPYNNYEVITGQATAAKELLEEASPLDFILTPVGGGGLLSGTALSAKFYSTATQVIAGEPELANDAFRSLQSGEIELPSPPSSIADGLLSSLGNKTFPIILEHVKKIITVSDREIISAMRLIWEKLKIIVEPSGAVPLAAVLKEKSNFYNKKVGIILSGGNVDLQHMSKLLAI
jgi:threonine dehydratase